MTAIWQPVSRLGRGNLIGVQRIDRELLDAADVHRGVDEGAAATGLARMLADKRACSGIGVVLADHVDRTGIVAFAGQGDVCGDVHMGRAHGLAGKGLADAFLAHLLLDVVAIFLLEGIHTLENDLACNIADCAVGGIAHDLGQGTHLVEHGFIRLAAHHLLHHVEQLRDTITAGHALAAGLQALGFQKRSLDRDGADARRGSLDPSGEHVEVTGDLAEVLRLRSNGQSCHQSSSLLSFSSIVWKRLPGYG